MTAVRSMPAQKPGRSTQEVGTDRAFLAAVERRFGPISYDLAAIASNAVCARFFTPLHDSLSRPWGNLAGNLWLNPPYGDIAPWARKCAGTPLEGRRIFLLVPASVGSNWFADHVWGLADVYFLRPRLTFVGHNDPYPKDLMLCVYRPALGPPGGALWKWKE